MKLLTFIRQTAVLLSSFVIRHSSFSAEPIDVLT